MGILVIYERISMENPWEILLNIIFLTIGIRRLSKQSMKPSLKCLFRDMEENNVLNMSFMLLIKYFYKSIMPLKFPHCSLTYCFPFKCEHRSISFFVTCLSLNEITLIKCSSFRIRSLQIINLDMWRKKISFLANSFNARLNTFWYPLVYFLKSYVYMYFNSTATFKVVFWDVFHIRLSY